MNFPSHLPWTIRVHATRFPVPIIAGSTSARALGANGTRCIDDKRAITNKGRRFMDFLNHEGQRDLNARRMTNMMELAIAATQFWPMRKFFAVVILSFAGIATAMAALNTVRLSKSPSAARVDGIIFQLMHRRGGFT